MITAKQAALLCQAHEVNELLENEEELELLEANNPELLAAYKALIKASVGGKSQSKRKGFRGRERTG